MIAMAIVAFFAAVTPVQEEFQDFDNQEFVLYEDIEEELVLNEECECVEEMISEDESEFLEELVVFEDEE